MTTPIYNPLFVGGLFLGMLLMLEIGRRLGRRKRALDTKSIKEGTGVINSSIFSLLGLLIAFTFSGAANRFEIRRLSVIEEANAIETAWLRLDLLPDEPAGALRDLVRQYLDSRIEIYERLHYTLELSQEIAHTAQLKEAIWNNAIAACREPDVLPSQNLVLTSLNEVFDIASSRLEATGLHPPPVIFWMLAIFSLAGALLAGFAMSGSHSRNWTHILSFALVLSITVYVITDLEYPRLGLIQVNKADNILKELRMNLN